MLMCARIWYALARVTYWGRVRATARLKTIVERFTRRTFLVFA
jgi:hypothetical protein